MDGNMCIGFGDGILFFVKSCCSLGNTARWLIDGICSIDVFVFVFYVFSKF